MPNIVSAATLAANHDNPGAPSNNRGPTWARGQHDDLQTIAGSTIGLTSNEDLRRQFARLGIPGAHTDGRNVLVERYVGLLKKVHDGAGQKALADWFEK